MDDWQPLLVGLLTLGGPLLAYLLAVRKAAGRIKSSEASDLWEEAGAIRRECAERVRALESDKRELEQVNAELRKEVMRLTRASFGDFDARG